MTREYFKLITLVLCDKAALLNLKLHLKRMSTETSNQKYQKFSNSKNIAGYDSNKRKGQHAEELKW